MAGRTKRHRATCCSSRVQASWPRAGFAKEGSRQKRGRNTDATKITFFFMFWVVVASALFGSLPARRGAGGRGRGLGALESVLSRHYPRLGDEGGGGRRR